MREYYDQLTLIHLVLTNGDASEHFLFLVRPLLILRFPVLWQRYLKVIDALRVEHVRPVFPIVTSCIHLLIHRYVQRVVIVAA